MEHTTVVGIDVSKDRLDVHVLPSQEAWAVSRDADGLAELCRRLAGLAPFVRQSGRWKGQAHIGGGRPTVRTALFLGAQVAKRHNPPLKAFYERLIAAGKSKMAATIAVAHKLLLILNAILRDKKPWQTA